MNRQEFEVILLKPPDIDGAYFIVPFNVPEVYGTKVHVKVRGTIDGFPYRGLIANMGEGHCMVVMDIDTEPRIVAVPEDFQQALGNNQKVKEVFDKFSHTHKKEYVEWIEGAKKQETRENRVKKAIEMIDEGKKR